MPPYSVTLKLSMGSGMPQLIGRGGPGDRVLSEGGGSLWVSADSRIDVPGHRRYSWRSSGPDRPRIRRGAGNLTFAPYLPRDKE